VPITKQITFGLDINQSLASQLNSTDYLLFEVQCMKAKSSVTKGYCPKELS
jgi:hypothetical protein